MIFLSLPFVPWMERRHDHILPSVSLFPVRLLGLAPGADLIESMRPGQESLGEECSVWTGPPYH